MSVTLEQIDLVRERCHVSYKRAKEVLEACNGNLVDAMVMLEKDRPQKDYRREEMYESKNNFKKGIKSFFKTLTRVRFTIVKDHNIVLEFPILLGLLASIIMFVPLLIMAFVAMLFEYQYKLVDEKERNWIADVNSAFDGAYNMVQKLKTKMEAK